MNLKSRLATHLIVAQEEETPDQLRVLIDDGSNKLVNKIYKQYISQQDFSRYHAFLTDFDRLLARFGGQPPQVMQAPNPSAPQQPQVQQPQQEEEEDK